MKERGKSLLREKNDMAPGKVGTLFFVGLIRRFGSGLWKGVS